MSANRVSKLGAWKQARRDRYGAENVCRDGSLKGKHAVVNAVTFDLLITSVQETRGGSLMED